MRSIHPATFTLAAAVALAAAAPARAQEGAPVAAARHAGPQYRFLVSAALEGGGDPVATVLFEDGSEQKMPAGQGGTIAAGAELRPVASVPVSLRATVGFKYMTTKATNANITLTRVPIELVGDYWLANGVHFGGGYVRQEAVKFGGGGMGDDFSFKPANGVRGEIGWKGVAAIYTSMKYHDEAGDELDASAFGVNFTLGFGGRR
jgi:hypothetical protein